MKQSQNPDFGIDMAWSVLTFLIFCDNPYSVLASAFQHLPANIAVDSPKCETVDTFGVTFANVSGSGASGSYEISKNLSNL